MKALKKNIYISEERAQVYRTVIEFTEFMIVAQIKVPFYQQAILNQILK